jgi:hypothetical protein
MLGCDAVQFGQNVPSLRRDLLPPSTLQIHVGTTSYVNSGQFLLRYVVACSRRQRTVQSLFSGLRTHTQFTSQYGELSNVAPSNLVDMYQRSGSRLRLKCDGTRAETRFRLSAKRASPFKSAGASVQWTVGNRGVRISGSNAGYTTFRGSVKSTGYPLHSPLSPSLPLPCVTMCHHISTGVYLLLPP